MLSYIYLCKKHCHLLCWVYKKNNSFLSFHSSIFHSKIHKHPACKMNRDEHGESRLKIWSFEWTYFLNNPKVSLLPERSIHILIFNLTHYLISLIGSFHFPQWKIFFPIHWQILKILGNGISIICFEFEMWPSSFVWILHLIFNSEA